MNRKKRMKKTNKNDDEIWTEEQYEDYMKELFGLDFIAGYTEGGMPYGIPLDNDNEEVKLSGIDSYDSDGEELPFD